MLCGAEKKLRESVAIGVTCGLHKWFFSASPFQSKQHHY